VRTEPNLSLVELTALVFAPVEKFAASEDKACAPLATARAGGIVIPAEGNVLIYGDGGVGKTTLEIDLCFALAAGKSWLDIIDVDRPLRIMLIENEGPRQEFRGKLKAKLAATVAELEGRIVVLEEPWAEFSFADDANRRALALALTERETDLLVVGPLTSAGLFPNGGTPDEISRFEDLLRELRLLVRRPFAILLIHHENRAGQISGAWDRFPDTTIHISTQGNGRTRLYWQKARWAGALHKTSMSLLWADGETYTIENKPEITDETMADDLLAAIRADPGAAWTVLRGHIRGSGNNAPKVRDRLIKDGLIVNRPTRKGGFNLWPGDDPVLPHSVDTQ
jgi:hypothetical protein